MDFSPAFIWLLRDFQLRLEDNGKPITPAEYLELALLPLKGGEADIANKNKVCWPCCTPEPHATSLMPHDTARVLCDGATVAQTL